MGRRNLFTGIPLDLSNNVCRTERERERESERRGRGRGRAKPQAAKIYTPTPHIA